MTKYLAALFALALASAPYQALALTATGADKLTIGKPGSTADKIIQLGTGVQGKIKYDATDGKLKTANDGVTFKSIGTGSGGGSGGIELLKDNADFESGVFQNWTASAPSTVSEDTGSSALFDLKSAHFVPTTSGQTYTSQAYSIDRGLWTGPCLASVFYTSAESTNFVTMQVLDGSNVALSPAVPMTRNVGAAAPLYVPFTCPSSGTAKIQFASTGVATALVLDNAHLGSENRTREIDQSSVVGTVTYPFQTCPTSTHTSSGTSAWADFTGADCPSVVVSGGVSVASGALTYTVNLPPGEYDASWSGLIGCSAASVTVRLSDGTGTGGTTQIDPGAGGHINYLASHFSYPNGGTKTFKVQQLSATGVCSTTINSDSSGQFVLKRSPLGSQTITQNSGQAAYFFANQDAPTSVVATGSYIDFNPSLGTNTLTVKRSNGITAVAEASGLPAVTVTFPKIQTYRACVTGIIGGGSSDQVSLRLIDAASSYVVGYDTSYHSTPSKGNPFRLCGDYTPPSLAPVTLKIQEKSANNMGFGNDSGVYLQWEIFQLDAGQAAVAYPGIVSTPASGQKKVISARVSQCTTDPCTIVAGGEGVSAINRSGAGQYTATLSSGFSGAPDHCSYSTYDGTGSAVAVGNGLPAAGSIGINTFTASTNTAVDTSLGFSFSCIGPK